MITTKKIARNRRHLATFFVYHETNKAVMQTARIEQYDDCFEVFKADGTHNIFTGFTVPQILEIFTNHKTYEQKN